MIVSHAFCTSTSVIAFRVNFLVEDFAPRVATSLSHHQLSPLPSSSHRSWCKGNIPNSRNAILTTRQDYYLPSVSAYSNRIGKGRCTFVAVEHLDLSDLVPERVLLQIKNRRTKLPRRNLVVEKSRDVCVCLWEETFQDANERVERRGQRTSLAGWDHVCDFATTSAGWIGLRRVFVFWWMG
jgi:hypothetical protein